MKCLPLILLLTLSIIARSQDEGSLYIFDSNWKPTKIETAHFLLHTHQLNDTCWQWDFYNFVGPLIKSEQYRDKDGNEINGVSHHYNENGYVDSTGNFSRGKRNGEFLKLDGDSHKYKLKYIYRDDSLVEVIDLEKQKKDSVKSYNDEKESDYPGGSKGWQRYLVKNLKYPERAMNGNIQGQVIIQFVVDKAGNVIDPYITHSVEYSMDETALRIVKDSGKWEPAFQNGHNVKSYKMQPINFKLQ
jgi:periplasmic protein TonB